MTRWPALMFSFCLAAVLDVGLPLVGQQPPASTNRSPSAREPPSAKEPTSAQEKEQIEAALKLTREAAGKYEIVLDGGDAPARLRAEPVLRWSNPAVGEIHGNVFLWTMVDREGVDRKDDRNAVDGAKADRAGADAMGGGRPLAVGSLFKWFSPHKHTSHEFQSLAEGPITASYEGRQVWVSKQPGVKFVPLEGVATPAATPSRRLTQMRDLAKRFAGHMTTRENDERELRLLPQPIYRYSGAHGQSAGGLFAFVEATDPEILLLLEARGEKSPRWHFAGARMQNVAMTLKFDDREVWSVSTLEWSVAFDHTQPYTLFDTPGK